MTRSHRFGGAAALAWLVALAAPARAQEGMPRILDQNERSGLVTRFQKVLPTLPPDPKRDQWYDTRWADSPDVTHPNSCKHGGLYGLPLGRPCGVTYPGYSTAYPNRFGEASTVTGDCTPPNRVTRLVTNFVHPFRPVCYYYADGAFVPVYDLDPVVTGPGPFPWPFFLRRPIGG